MTLIQLLVNGIVFPLKSRRIICGKSNYRNNENETFWAKCDRLFFFLFLFSVGYRHINEYTFVEVITFKLEINVKSSLSKK